MTPQALIRSWIPPTLEIFNKYMPLSNLPGSGAEEGQPSFPPIRIGSPKTLMKLRAALVEQTGSRQVNAPDPYNSIMEMIHGDKGDAILIQQELIPDPRIYRGADFAFQHYLWHELGHFYAIHAEKTDLHRYNDSGLAVEDNTSPLSFSPDRIRQEGYWLWSEFIAESIANYVDERHCRIDNAELYHPEKITWHPTQWGHAVDRLEKYLDMAFETYDFTVDEAALGTYFATLLMDDFTKRYVEAAEEGKLWRYKKKESADEDISLEEMMERYLKKLRNIDDAHGDITREIEPVPAGGTANGGIDPTCFDEYHEGYLDTLNDMKELLSAQVKKEKFWEITEDWLEELGNLVVNLMVEKIMLMSSQISKDGEYN